MSDRILLIAIVICAVAVIILVALFYSRIEVWT
jgi:cell division protein FtsL